MSNTYTKPSAGSAKLQNLVNAEACYCEKYGLGAQGDDSKQRNVSIVRKTAMPVVSRVSFCVNPMTFSSFYSNVV
ncbi:hypothetical protein AC625_08990 [Peribacillus loiseleuriae]|uniref:Uncharacterized protein n=1 Tax=Peribacillus loiseleuriae TaxID=1679170 RepID=A0A0K9GSR6_9BACI|nr:hypothetical protein AC625_08990 [Peribacillus loiseleuriae]